MATNHSVGVQISSHLQLAKKGRTFSFDDDLTDLAPIVLSRGLVVKCIYRAVDLLGSTSTMLQYRVVGKEHYETTQIV